MNCSSPNVQYIFQSKLKSSSFWLHAGMYHAYRAHTADMCPARIAIDMYRARIEPTIARSVCIVLASSRQSLDVYRARIEFRTLILLYTALWKSTDFEETPYLT